MAGSNPLNFQGVVKHRSHTLYFLFGSEDEVKASCDRIKPRINLRGLRQNILNARMRAPHQNGESFLRANGQGEFVHL